MRTGGEGVKVYNVSKKQTVDADRDMVFRWGNINTFWEKSKKIQRIL